ncbi:bifunctional phosphopantothenoylcysteine decarboxylase/phosphopantothenate--cysteine ligase CoaBC [Pinibacter aurantiacus]|uniref:Coenzyme A biosynthesis bifunctional protein CoaBC n=1 Tax=Pinibacter aurantiacus TaxID=2851599 RepID=A0A9E2SDW6_9BACT|nr:bifunctional phosphopantothenoylcysteine decarboxylase/phosphopantothenate--cysteine ligase CoaBC [Pinibacter aurantiacus]MBV4358135.1 bifunctional phosphopantothenoylcysteine decarboxylase/phosphopantothenate--cysteine ligase CoaBC [Pinibacter aurantiacus]
MFQGKKILIGITGSIAAYKTVVLVRELVKQGAEVKVVMTPAAKDFVAPLTLSTLSKNTVLTDLFENDSWANHVMLGRWADVMLIAPLSCNTLARMAHGLCDNLLLAIYLSATCPVFVAPAMDDDMWHHPSTKENLKKLDSFGNHIIPAEKGELASGLFGDGRMAEVQTILAALQSHFDSQKELAGKKVLITAGPTYELLDPVRFIGNHSSGKMGVAIANELANRGAEVTLVLGPSNVSVDEKRIKTFHVTSAKEMYDVCVEQFPQMNVAVMAAAVADYTPVNTFSEKIKKNDGNLVLELQKTKDILKSLGEIKKDNQLLIGFALETKNEVEYAKSKLKDKNADIIVLNSLRDKGAGFGTDTNKITIFEKSGTATTYDQKDKALVAKDIADVIVKNIYA